MVFPSGRVFKEDNIFERLGGKVMKKTTLAIPYFNTAPLCIAESDLVMIVPTRIAKTFTKFSSIQSIPIPSNSENFSYRLIWHERAQKDLGNKWLRNEIGKSTKEFDSHNHLSKNAT
jgi:DNA-binding transcriptional LysR family regulator